VIADGVPFSEFFLRPNTMPLYVVGLASLVSPVGCQGKSHAGGSLHDTSGYDPNVTSDVRTPDLDPARLTAMKARVAELLPTLREDLEALTRIPSVSLAAFDQAHVEASAQAVESERRKAGGCQLDGPAFGPF